MAKSAKQIILEYYQSHLGEWIHNQTFREITGANDIPRTIRDLRQRGWQIKVRGDGYTRLVSSEKGEPKGERDAISERHRFEVLQRDGFSCRACGRSPERDGIVLQVDHILPVDWGGKTELDNLQSLCEECNRGKKAWVASHSSQVMKEVAGLATVEQRIEALFDHFPNQDVPSSMIQLVARAFDWQRALRRIRERTGKKIQPTSDRRGYHYFRD
jgi:5-methylcytosine-specific restriction endonuclease McrA